MKGVQLPKETPQRVEVVEEPTEKMGGPTYKAVKPKTYQILQQELGGDSDASGPKAATPQARSSGSGCRFYLPNISLEFLKKKLHIKSDADLGFLKPGPN